MKKSILIALSLLTISGCTVRVADLTVGSTKNYDINSGPFIKGSRVTGEDLAPVILIPLGIPNLKTAMDNAIQTDKCAVGLTDIVISQLNHAFIVGQIGYRVEGDLIVDTNISGCENK